MSTYRHFAFFYDALMEHAPYDDWVRFTLDAIKDKPVNNVVDLGCGTGEITVRLAKEFMQVYGVDLSESMLSVAQEKAIAEKVDITFLKQDIRNLEGFNDVDLIISFCDVINYIRTESEVKRVFEQVYESLADEGVFIFDFHSFAYVKHHLINHTFADETEDLAYIWHCFGTETEGEMEHQMTFFHRLKREPNRYERFEEVHKQRTFSVAIYEQLLKEAKFTKIQFFSDFSTQNLISELKSERIFAIAQK